MTVLEDIVTYDDIFDDYDNNYYSRPLYDISNWIFNKLSSVYNYIVPTK